MKYLASVTTVFLVALGSVACNESMTELNSEDSNGPKVSAVSLCAYVEGSDCRGGTRELRAGSSVQLVAKAMFGSTDVTALCDFVWAANSQAVSLRVSQPRRTAVVTKNPFNVSGRAATVTATCNGVVGSFNVE